MNFRRGRRDDAPEINLIPFIDILLVVVIFLAVSTTYARFSELKIDLPSAAAEPGADAPARIDVAVTEDGRYRVGDANLGGETIEPLVEALKAAAASAREPVVVVNADARASHQSVVTVMEAARRAGLERLTFATRAEP